MHTKNFLITGSSGQLGTEITAALRNEYGISHVIATDLAPHNPESEAQAGGPYEPLDVCDAKALSALIDKYKITHIYHLAALLSAKAEQLPLIGWNVNMNGLLNVLEAARSHSSVKQVYFPSSIAVFGPLAPKQNCPQFPPADPATMYGITKLAGEQLCEYYYNKHKLDVRSLRYPGIISYKALPGGGTTDYAIDIFRKALSENKYTCYLKPDTQLPMMYIPDALHATFSLMEAPAAQIKLRQGYNIAGFSFSPAILAAAIQKHLPGFTLTSTPDFRQQIAESWPESIDDSGARNDWGWKPQFSLDGMVQDMLANLKPVLA